jgi:hypothetical protein
VRRRGHDTARVAWSGLRKGRVALRCAAASGRLVRLVAVVASARGGGVAQGLGMRARGDVHAGAKVGGRGPKRASLGCRAALCWSELGVSGSGRPRRYPPGPPTDPDVRVSRIRLLESWFR